MNQKTRRVLLLILLAVFLCGFCLLLALLLGGADWFLTFLQLTNHTVEKPTAFGAFHWLCLIACVLAALLCGIYGARNRRDKTDVLVFAAGLLLLVLELYKQFYSYFVLHDRIYDFGIFPFQFCTLPLYFCLLAPLLPQGLTKELLYKFLAFFGTMGGCLVMAYPAFYDRAALCVHTMLWHTVMIAVGVFILFSQGYGKSWRHEVLPATSIFLAALADALLLNFLLTPFSQNSPNPLNLFYLSPYQQSYFLVVGDVQRSLGWLPAVLTYALLFVFVGATLVFGVAFLIRQVARLLAK